MATKYPEMKIEACLYCQKPAIAYVRRGSGKGRNGKPNYWYETEHTCPQKVMLKHAAERALRSKEGE
jgi:ribosomal protein S4E